MLYNIESRIDCDIYTFDSIDLKIKCVENKDDVCVHINYNGYNPLLSMLCGGFESECDIDSISFKVKKESTEKDNSMYAIVEKGGLIGFVNEVYFFVMENDLENKLKESDKSVWTF
ncbi:hypothetical protein [Ruminococcus sp.]|uniref:hypothetical protein n=1 Tax=Ruminococcus sp. TaxID=41978 RepID=UPI0025E35D34|nr:hypothetical protein [Ruminococcus sp.]